MGWIKSGMLAILQRQRFTLLLAALSLVGVGLVLAREASYGPLLSSDSVVYIDVARNLLEGKGFARDLGGFYTTWAPLYPALLAAAGFGVFDPRDVAGPLNAVIFGLTVFAVGQYLRRRLESGFLVWWACLALIFSLPLVWLASWVLSGTLFILLATLALIQADRFLGEGKTSSLVWAAVFCALAWQARYIGVAVPVMVGLLLLFQQGASLPEKARRVVGFSLIVAVPMGLWLLRNYLLIGELTGNQRPIDYSLAEILKDIGDVIAGWAVFDVPFIYLGGPGWTSLGSVLVLGAVAGLILISAGYIFITGYILIKDLRKRESRSRWRSFCIFGGFVAVYLALLIAAVMSGSTWHGVGSRFLVPLYIPLLVAAVFAMDRFLSYERERKLLGSVGRLPIIRTFIRGGGRNKIIAGYLDADAFFVGGGAGRAQRAGNKPGQFRRYRRIQYPAVG